MLIQMEGPLFEAVQRARLFPDSKTFVDSVPKTDPKAVLAAFEAERGAPDFDLAAFVEDHFTLPQPVQEYASHPLDTSSLETYIDSLWPRLERSPEEAQEFSTLIPLKYPYLVPGGRFREIYYWDSYFTFLGMIEAGRFERVEHMVQNLIHLQDTLGLIPNGNRQYFATRSQPPVLNLMVRLLWDAHYHAEEGGLEHIATYLPALEREHAYWQGATRAVKLPDGTLLNHYGAGVALPRQESYGEDVALTETSRQHDDDLYSHLRAGAESGWDFSSRWLREASSLATIQTENIAPVDLNCLLYGLELTLSGFYNLLGNGKADEYSRLSQKRKAAIQSKCWNADESYYFDYNWRTRKQTEVWSLAGVVPLFVKLADKTQAERVKEVMMRDFLKPGGLVTSLHETGEQWDSPNGWAPLHWFAVQGLLNYGFEVEAETVARRWLAMIRTRFDEDKLLLEKYDVVNLDQKAGGGEYAVQEGFGWTNGVTLKFLKMYPEGASG